MKSRNFVISFLATAILVGCASSRRVEDLTLNRPATCELHKITMTQKRVTETYGMKVRYSPMDLARPALFPHADEPYDTGACMRSYRFARIWICAQCSQARTAWLETHAQ